MRDINYKCFIVPPVVHEQVRFPDVLGWNSDVGNVLVLGLVPGKVYIRPFLENNNTNSGAADGYTAYIALCS